MQPAMTGCHHVVMRALAESRPPHRVHIRPAVAAVLRCDPRIMRRLPAVLILMAIGLTAWVFELGAVLQGQAVVRDWSSVWVGLDLLEIAGLVATAVLVKRQSAYLSAVAAATATMFALDAWFDVLTATAGSAWYESLAAALLGEIPVAIVLAAIATHSARHQHSPGLDVQTGRPTAAMEGHLAKGSATAAGVMEMPAAPVTTVSEISVARRAHPSRQQGFCCSGRSWFLRWPHRGGPALGPYRGGP
jgi:hypothetical protein